MRTIEEAIFTRLKNDTSGSASLQSLLGGSGRIWHGLELVGPKAPGVYYQSMANSRGSIFTDNVKTSSEIYQFKVYADNNEDILYRLRILLDGYIFPDQVDTGSIRCNWDSDGPDMFDDAMMKSIKTVQFRIFMVPKAAAVV